MVILCICVGLLTVCVVLLLYLIDCLEARIFEVESRVDGWIE